MLKDRIRFVSAQPDARHFVWQTHVCLHNLCSLGVPPQNCVALFAVGPDEQPSAELRALCGRFFDADIRIYEDTRGEDGHGYAPSVQPHLIIKALHDSPEWEGELTFFHDCDIAFRRLPDFERMLREHPKACLLSDTRSYIGGAYLHECCEKIRAEKPAVPVDELIHKMAALVGIDVETVRENEAGSGGAQYVLQGVGVPYWEKVYRDSIELRRLFDGYLAGLDLDSPPADYLQVWTAGMWAYLWNLWSFGLETVVHPEMNFLFSGASSEDPGPILHMAGLPDALKHSHFNKSDWWTTNPVTLLSQQPFLFDHVPDGTVSREYADFIHQAAGVEPVGIQPLAPAPQWRLLAWNTSSKIWDIERVQFRFDPEVPIVRHFDSGHAGDGYEAAHVFDASPKHWGGRVECPETFPGLYLGVELERPAAPQLITMKHADTAYGVHRGRRVRKIQTPSVLRTPSTTAAPSGADDRTRMASSCLAPKRRAPSPSTGSNSTRAKRTGRRASRFRR